LLTGRSANQSQSEVHTVQFYFNILTVNKKKSNVYTSVKLSTLYIS